MLGRNQHLDAEHNSDRWVLVPLGAKDASDPILTAEALAKR